MTPISHPGRLLKRELEARGPERQQAGAGYRRSVRPRDRHSERPPVDHRRHGGASRTLFWQRRTILDRSPEPVRHRSGRTRARSRNRRTRATGRRRVICPVSGTVIGGHARSETPGYSAGRGLVVGGGARLELRPEVIRHLGSQVAHAMGEAALAHRLVFGVLMWGRSTRQHIDSDEFRGGGQTSTPNSTPLQSTTHRHVLDKFRSPR